MTNHLELLFLRQKVIAGALLKIMKKLEIYDDYEHKYITRELQDIHSPWKSVKDKP